MAYLFLAFYTESFQRYKPALFMLEQLRVIDKRRLRGYAGRLTKAQMALIDQAVCASLGLARNGA